jgi:hypothetical protein
MRREPPAGTIRLMGSAQPIEAPPGQIVVEVASSEPVSGVLHAAGGARSFEGWLELLAVLELALAAASPAEERGGKEARG